MDDNTEIASGFTIGRYKSIRNELVDLDASNAAWMEVIEAFQRRLRERFLLPIHELQSHDKKTNRPTRAGFAILALDCLLIDTIQSFREGRVSTGEGISPATSFRNFLKSKYFSGFSGTNRTDFFNYIRNALFHNGETRKNWKIRIDTDSLVSKDEKKREH